MKKETKASRYVVRVCMCLGGIACMNPIRLRRTWQGLPPTSQGGRLRCSATVRATGDNPVRVGRASICTSRRGSGRW